MSKKYFITYHDNINALRLLSDSERGRLYLALLEYSMKDENPQYENPKMSGNEKFMFEIMKAQIDRENEKYKKTCDRNRSNGMNGGRPKKELSKANNQKFFENTNTNETQKTQSVVFKPKETHNNTNKNTNTKTNKKTNNNILIAQSDKIAHEPPPQKIENVFIKIPLISGEEYPVSESLVEEYKKLYPNVDVEQELRKIRAWSLSNPKQRKTERGVLRCINTWLSKAQDKMSYKNNTYGKPRKMYGLNPDDVEDKSTDLRDWLGDDFFE